MSVDAQHRCKCGNYMDADGEDDSGTSVVTCSGCGQRWEMTWRITWERKDGTRGDDENGKAD